MSAKKIKIVKVDENTTYTDITEGIAVDESPETEPAENPLTENEPEPEPEPKPKPKARAKRVSKPKAVESFEIVPSVEEEPEGEFQVVKPKPKRVAKAKVIKPVPVEETPPVVPPPPEKAPEKPKLTRKPRAKKEEPVAATPTVPVKMSRAAKREELYQSLASSALP